MAQVTVVVLRLSIAILLGASLSEVFGTPLKEVHVIIDEEDTENRTREIELDIDLDDMPASITDAIQRGDYSKLIELEISIAEMNESSQTDDTLDSLDDGRWDRTIFPPDDRRPVSSYYLSRHPYCAIGYLKSGCTAAFIGPRHALTAAHCVVGQSTRTLDMCRGQSCSRGGQLMHYAGESYIPRGYYNWWSRNDYDYALLLYQETSPCYLRFGYRSSWGGYGFKVIGYPQDKRADDLDHCTYHSMFYSECSRSYTLGRYRFKYHCDAIGGNSGSPLMSRDPDDSNAQRIVYGIHTHSSPNYNLGARITQTRFATLWNGCVREVTQQYVEANLAVIVTMVAEEMGVFLPMLLWSHMTTMDQCM